MTLIIFHRQEKKVIVIIELLMHPEAKSWLLLISSIRLKVLVKHHRLLHQLVLDKTIKLN